MATAPRDGAWPRFLGGRVHGHDSSVGGCMAKADIYSGQEINIICSMKIELNI